MVWQLRLALCVYYMIHNYRKYKFGHQLHQLSCSARQDNIDKMVSGVIVSPDLKRWYILLQLRISSFTRLHQHHTLFITSSKVHNCTIGYYQLTLKLVKACYHVQSHKTSLNPPLFIEVTVQRQENERSCICILGVSIYLLFYDYSIRFRNCSDSMIVFIFLLSQYILYSQQSVI